MIRSGQTPVVRRSYGCGLRRGGVVARISEAGQARAPSHPVSSVRAMSTTSWPTQVWQPCAPAGQPRFTGRLRRKRGRTAAQVGRSGGLGMIPHKQCLASHPL